MAGRIVTVVSGVMEPLIGKLNALMGDEYDKFTGVRKQASFLEKELSAMYAALHKLELVDELDPTVKDWVDHVRDMSYDMENCIDDFMHQFRDDDANSGFIEKITQFIKKFRQRLRIADRMEELKTLALEANDRRERYKIDDWKPASGHVAVDPRLRAIYQEEDTLVGIDGPREEVVTWLMDTQKKLKVVPIVGFGGLGKTTLAKQVYDKIDSQFDCKAFFSVSQRPDMSELLNNLQFKFGMKDPVSARARKVDDIIKELREHLKKKREEVATRLLDTQKKLKVVSIVGFGGLGKTTLAKQVYDKISSQFDCKAFFSVSQRPDMTELLNNLQYKLGMNNPVSSHTRKVDDIIEELREHLKKKRCRACSYYSSLH